MLLIVLERFCSHILGYIGGNLRLGLFVLDRFERFERVFNIFSVVLTGYLAMRIPPCDPA